MKRAIGILAVAVGAVMIVPPDSAHRLVMRMIEAVRSLPAAAAAQDVYPFNNPDCPEQTAFRWCASKAMGAGWRLKYEIKAPDGIMDVYWATEIWVRGHEAMLCSYSSGRGGTMVNRCEALREVT
jgi:hypothetical protein